MLSEPVLHEVCYQGRQQAIITQNQYGCLILNTGNLLIVDVDIGVLKDSDSRNYSLSCQIAISQQQAIAALKKLVERFPQLGFRVYRTRNGLRYFCTTQEFDPSDQKTHRLMQNLYVDPLYARLCKFQATFRARLTPKPWRVEIVEEPKRFVYERSIGLVLPESNYYGVCHLIEIIGEQSILPEFEETIQVHDIYCQANQLELDLA